MRSDVHTWKQFKTGDNSLCTELYVCYTHLPFFLIPERFVCMLLSPVRHFTFALLCFIVATTGCIEVFSPEVSAPSSPPLVVEGTVVNGTGPHEVRLTRAAAFEQSLDGLVRGVSDASVTITDTTIGRTVLLRETERSGMYRTEADELSGTPGSTYRLDIVLIDGTHYRSTPQTMPPPVPIDSVTVAFDTSPTPGFSIGVEAPEPAGEPNFYRWSVRATYEAAIFPEPRTPPFFCWADDSSSNMVPLREDLLIDGKRIVQEPVHFVPLTQKTSLGYQVDVRQQTLTTDAFAFWEAIKEQIENTGDTFAPPPSPIRSNIRNLTDPSFAALGFFTAVGQTEATVCVNPRDFPEAPFPGTGREDDTCNGPRVSFQRPPYWVCSSATN